MTLKMTVREKLVPSIWTPWQPAGERPHGDGTPRLPSGWPVH